MLLNCELETNSEDEWLLIGKSELNFAQGTDITLLSRPYYYFLVHKRKISILMTLEDIIIGELNLHIVNVTK